MCQSTRKPSLSSALTGVISMTLAPTKVARRNRATVVEVASSEECRFTRWCSADQEIKP
jgi:hypothetical protein